MVRYQFLAKSSQSTTVGGDFIARDREDAVAQLRKQGLVPLRVEPLIIEIPPPTRPPRRLPSEELVLFTRQMSTMVSQGLPILDTLRTLDEGARLPATGALAQHLIYWVSQGKSLSAAMNSCGRVFSSLQVSLVRAGEASGRLDEILERLAEHEEQSQAQRRELISAMTYPAVSVVLVLGIALFLLTVIVPSFKELFEELGSDLPASTRGLLAVSDWLRGWLLELTAAVTLVALSTWTFLRSSPGRALRDLAMLRLPVVGELTRRMAVTRFARTLSTLMHAGVPILAALDLVTETAGNQPMARAISRGRFDVSQGRSLSETLGRSSLFPPMVVHMIATGERTAALPNLLERIADFYQSEVRASIRSLASLAQPVMICFLGLFVGGILLAIFQALLQIVGDVGAQG